MCVIAVKKYNVPMLARDVLERMADANRDGFGFVKMDSRGHYKCFKTVDKDAFLKEALKIRTDEAAIIHCRLATHGSARSENCHPFVQDGFAFAHNGVLGGFGNVGDMTDSESFFKFVVMPMLERLRKNAGHKYFQDFMASVALDNSSRFALADFRKKEIHLFGVWQEKYGCSFSNLHFDAMTYGDYMDGWDWGYMPRSLRGGLRFGGVSNGSALSAEDEALSAEDEALSAEDEAMLAVDSAYDDLELYAMCIGDAMVSGVVGNSECAKKQCANGFKKCFDCDEICPVRHRRAAIVSAGAMLGMTGADAMNYVAQSICNECGVSA